MKVIDCPHLRGVTGRTSCANCTNNTQLKVYNCSAFGRCTIAKEIEGVSCCRTCPLNPQMDDPMIRLKWAYGVTTCPSRRESLLPKTLASLRDAGFCAPHLFVDGASSGFTSVGPALQLSGITYRDPAVGVYGNWILSMVELYIRSPLVDRYVLFQDDLLACGNLRRYLDNSPYPVKGYLNLYSSTPNNEALLIRGDGWYESDQMGRGALAIVFSREVLVALFTDQFSLKHLINKPTDNANGKQNVDGAINECMKSQGIKEYIHNPSLVQHTGILSTIRNQSFKAKTWRPDFDPMTLIH